MGDKLYDIICAAAPKRTASDVKYLHGVERFRDYFFPSHDVEGHFNGNKVKYTSNELTKQISKEELAQAVKSIGSASSLHEAYSLIPLITSRVLINIDDWYMFKIVKNPLFSPKEYTVHSIYKKSE